MKLLNTAVASNPLNWLIVFLMILIPCLGMELIFDRRENGCGCTGLFKR